MSFIIRQRRLLLLYETNSSEAVDEDISFMGRIAFTIESYNLIIALLP